MSLSAWRHHEEGARPIGEIAKALLRRKKFHEKGKFGALVRAWGALVGEAVATRTRIRSFKDGNLVIEVDSSVLLHEIRGFMKQQLLLGLQATEAGRDVAEIRLCLGPSQDGCKSKEAGSAGS
jgi:predicted nucleic acid-binding Zn ribbon protein